MLSFFQAIPFAFAAIFPVLNPLGSAVIFLTLAPDLTEAEYKHLALRITINTIILLVAVLITGSWVLRFFGISLPVVQIGGGLVVAYIGWNLLNKPVASSDTASVPLNRNKSFEDMAFFPLTMPITAGPGCIAVTLAVGAHETSHNYMLTLWQQVGAIVGIVLVSSTVFFCYRYANRITATLGHSGTQVIMRLAAFINLCIGIEIIWNGVSGLI